MATTTPNFGWPVPTSTDLVKDGATAIEGLGDAIDASLLDLKGGTTGQVLKKNSNTDMDFIWSADSAGMTNPMTTTGDTIYSSSGSTPARLGIGTTGQVLTVAGGVPSWATPAAGGGGKVLQVLTGTANTNINSTSGTYADTGLTVTITPSASTSKVLIMVTIDYRKNSTSAQTGVNFQLLRGATVLTTSTDLVYSDPQAMFMASTYALTFLDSPSTTSATTYKLQFARNGGAGTATVIYGGSSSQANITVMEIGA